MISTKYLFLLVVVVVVLLPAPAAAFGAGNIASISRIEGVNWRHGDIEDMLSTVACLRGHKWTSLMIKRVYFGNWLRDYSQAVDVGTLKGVQADTIRILVWILAFMSFGYATGEFEVTAERLGVYRPEEHIDNPRDYADNADARQYDARLRGPVMPQELAIDPNTGMKNYIANEQGGWATSSGYIKFSFARAIHFGRCYTHGSQKGREEDLAEALRCLGQGLHCLEDFGAHSNYTELSLRELGFNQVFPHTGVNTQMNLRGKYVFPLVTGTFGGVDFLHSVLGEANDHLTQSEIDEVNTALSDAAGVTGGSTGKRSVGGDSGGNSCSSLIEVLSKVPGTGSLCQEAQDLQRASEAQEASNHSGAGYQASRAGNTSQPFAGPPGSQGGPPAPGIPGMNPNLDPTTIIPKIYPILAFRDKVARAISSIVSKVPGLEKLLDSISERVTVFVLSLLAPFVRPIIEAVNKQLKVGSSAVVDASGRHQFEPWTDPNCTDPTHSLLSKDHFSNILNEPAGKVATVILQYVAPRVLYAMDHPDIPVDQVLRDIERVFHHPAIRDNNLEIHRTMFATVEKWSQGRHNLNSVLSSESVKAGKNHTGAQDPPQGYHHHHHSSGGHGGGYSGGYAGGSSSHSKVSGSPWSIIGNKLSSAVPLPSSLLSGPGFGSGRREIDDFDAAPAPNADPGFQSTYPADFAPYQSAYANQPMSPSYTYNQSASDANAYGGGYYQSAGDNQGGYGGAYGGSGAYGNAYSDHAAAQGAMSPTASSHQWQTGYQGGWDEQQRPQEQQPQDQWGQQGNNNGGGGGWFSSR